MQNDKLKRILTPEVCASYSGLLPLSNLPLVLADTGGRILHEFIPMPEFCRGICHRGGDLCPACVHAIGEADGRQYTGCCPRGLQIIAVPVEEEGGMAACMLGGFCYQSDMAYQKYLMDVPDLAARSGSSEKDVAKACADLRTEPQEHIHAHGQLCAHIADNISKKLQGARQPAQSIEKALLEKEMFDRESRDNSQMTVNANFLFNMLNCAARIAYFEQAQMTENIIYCLSDLLRYNAQGDTVAHTVQAELEYMEKYLYIQKARFQSRLKYTIDVPDHIRSCPILNSVLQPVVDNALIHGILLKRDGGEVNISAECRGKKITFLIRDNGVGFSKESLDALEKARFLAGSNSLCRTNRRLKAQYGEEFGLAVVKSDFSGSTVAVTIPAA